MSDLYDQENVTLLDLVDRLLNKGVVIAGDLVISVADVDLLFVSLRAMVTSIESVSEKFEELRETGQAVATMARVADVSLRDNR